MSDREFKESRELNTKQQVDKYIGKFPPNENFLGFENVSLFFCFNINFSIFRIRTYAMPIRQHRFCIIVNLSDIKYSNGSQQTLKNIT